VRATEFLRRYISTHRFTRGLIRDARFVAESSRVLFVRSLEGSKPTNGLFELDLNTGIERLILDPATIQVPAGLGMSRAEKTTRQRRREQATGVTAFSTALDGTTIGTSVDGAFLLGRRDQACRWSWRLAGVSGAHAVAINPAGTRAALLVDGSFTIFDLADHDANECVIHGRPMGLGRVDFIAAEEIGRYQAAWWHPDGNRLLAAAVDERSVPEAALLETNDPTKPSASRRYPFAGTSNPVSSLWVVTISGHGEAVATPLPTPPFEAEYLVTASWRSDGRAPRSVWQSRDQRTVVGFEYRDQGWVLLFRLDDPAWVPVAPSKYLLGPRVPIWIDDSGEGSAAVVIDGQRTHAESVSPRRLLAATADGVVAEALSEARGTVGVGVVHIERSGATTWLSEPGKTARGWASQSAVLVQEESLVGARASVQRLAGALPIPVRVTSELPAIAISPVFHEIRGRCRIAVLRPSDWRGETLPVLLDTYGGPGVHRTEPCARSLALPQWFAEQAFGVVVVDGRASPSPERKLERTLRGNIAEAVLADQLTGLDIALSLHPELDAGSVAVRGWSFGGYLALLCAHAAPQRFRATVAGAPVTDWRWYDTHYAERYLGHPTTDSRSYDAASVLDVSDQLRVPTLLVHGLEDDNVLAMHSLAYFERAFAAGCPIELVALAGVSHFVSEENLALALMRHEAAFLHRHLAIARAGSGSLSRDRDPALPGTMESRRILPE